MRQPRNIWRVTRTCPLARLRAVAVASALALSGCGMFGPELPEDPLPEATARQDERSTNEGEARPPAAGKRAPLYGDPESTLVPEIDVEVDIEPVQEAEIVVEGESEPDSARQPERTPQVDPAPDPDSPAERKREAEQAPEPADAPEAEADPLTPMDQSSAPSDLEITRKLRWAVVHDDSLSFDARNVAIITIDGVVTLRGLVHSRAERDRIIALARTVGGIERIRDRLIVDD